MSIKIAILPNRRRLRQVRPPHSKEPKAAGAIMLTSHPIISVAMQTSLEFTSVQSSDHRCATSQTGPMRSQPDRRDEP